jgi:HEPN domain-containing protein
MTNKSLELFKRYISECNQAVKECQPIEWYEKKYAEMMKLVEESIFPENCLCAAIEYNGKIYRGHRHGDCVRAITEEVSFDHSRKEMLHMNMMEKQGFLTNYGRYVSREEGRKLQEDAGIESVDEEGYRGKTLFSEDLY